MYDFAPMLGRLPDSVDAIRHASQSIRLHGTMPLSRFERLRSSLLSDEGDVEVELSFDQDSEHRPYVMGSIRGALTVQCQRCEKPLTIAIDAPVHVGLVRNDEDARRLSEHLEPFLLTDRMVSLTELVEDELILALPIVPRHEHECVAVGAVSAVAAAPSATEEKRKNPFAVLAQLRPEKDDERH